MARGCASLLFIFYLASYSSFNALRVLAALLYGAAAATGSARGVQAGSAATAQIHGHGNGAAIAADDFLIK